jgi:putative ABC transport system permease protein
MPISLKIALRNILLHKGKSLIIGAILLMGALIMTVGNATLSGMDSGIRAGLVDGFMGDITVFSKRQKRDDVISGAKTESTEIIIDYPKLKSYLEKKEQVARFMPYTGNLFLTILDQERDQGMRPPFVYALGVDFERYIKMYDSSIETVAGRFPKPGERGIVLHVNNRERFYQMSGVILSPLDEPNATNGLPAEAVSNMSKLGVLTNLVIMGLSDRNSTLDIRIPILGFYHNKKIDMLGVDLIDLESYREAMNYSTAEDSSQQLSEAENKLLKLDENPDTMFSAPLVTEVATGRSPDLSSLFSASDKKPKKIELDSGTYEMVSLRIKDSKKTANVVENLNQDFKTNGLDARAVSWNKAAGALASLVTILKGSLNVFVFLIFFVAIIIIMNTLTMTTLERSAELGMMRAIGAQKGFLRRMLFSETLLLSVIFGGLGIALGTGIVLFLSHQHLSTSNRFLQIFYGGNFYNPLLSVSDYLIGLIELALVTILSVLYPMSLATKIRPLDAITRD